jgi:DNA modification methylase
MSNRSPRDTARPPVLTGQLKVKTRNQRRVERKIMERASRGAPRNDLLPNLVIEQRLLSNLKAPARRVRKYDLDDVVGLAQSIEQFGFTVPIIVGEDGQIIDGELRFEAARWLQLEKIPCLAIGHLSPNELRAFTIAANRIGQSREWDLDVLREEMEELLKDEFDIDALGFQDEEVDIILSEDGPKVEEPAPEPIPADEALPLTQLGDLWQQGRHRLLCGDALDPESYKQLLGDEEVQLLLADAPYNVKISGIVSTPHREFVQASGEMSDDQFEAFLATWLACAFAVMEPGAVGFAFMNWRGLEILLRAVRAAAFEQLDLVIWVKDNAGMGNLYRLQHELVVVMKKPGADHKNHIQLGAKGRWRSNCWFAPGANAPGSDTREMLKSHPTPKPVQLLSDAIIDVTDRGDIVLDSFGGSGSTMIAAERTGRIARLIELDPVYCDVILRRWLNEKGEEPVLLNTGESLAMVMKRRAAEAEEMTDARLDR